MNTNSNNGFTPLHLAIIANYNDVAKHLIECGADVNSKDNHGSTPLHTACVDGRTDVAKLLIANGAVINVKDNYGVIPLGATEPGTVMAKLLIDNGSAKFTLDKVEEKPQYGIGVIAKMKSPFFSLLGSLFKQRSHELK